MLTSRWEAEAVDSPSWRTARRSVGPAHRVLVPVAALSLEMTAWEVESVELKATELFRTLESSWADCSLS